MEEHTVYDGMTPVLFSGELLAQSTTESTDPRRRSVRWLEMELYKRSNGSYLLHTISCSDVYHAPGSSCRGGTLMAASELTDSSVACLRCEPPELDDLGPEEQVRYETDVSVVYPDLDAKEIRTYLRDPSKPVHAPLSAPARQLLRDAMNKDPELKRSLTEPVRLPD